MEQIPHEYEATYQGHSVINTTRFWGFFMYLENDLL